MLAAGKPALIENVASLGALNIIPEQTPYIISTHAVLSFSERLYLEMAHAASAIRVSAVLLGAVAIRIFTDAQMSKDKQAIQFQQASRERLLQTHGMSANEAGEMILDQIVERRFWVTTDPDMLQDRANRRAAHLETLAKPALAPEFVAILGM